MCMDLSMPWWVCVFRSEDNAGVSSIFSWSPMNQTQAWQKVRHLTGPVNFHVGTSNKNLRNMSVSLAKKMDSCLQIFSMFLEPLLPLSCVLCPCNFLAHIFHIHTISKPTRVGKGVCWWGWGFEGIWEWWRRWSKCNIYMYDILEQ